MSPHSESPQSVNSAQTQNEKTEQVSESLQLGTESR